MGLFSKKEQVIMAVKCRKIVAILLSIFFCASMYGKAVERQRRMHLPLTTDYTRAKEIARDHDLPLCIVFMGSDWNQQSQTLIKTFFEQRAAARLLRNKFVFLKVDFKEIENQDIAIIEENNLLKTMYDIQEFPTLVLESPKGEEITRMSFIDNSDESLLSRLKSTYLHYVTLERGLQKHRHSDSEVLEDLYKRATFLESNFYKKKVLDLAEEKKISPFLMAEQLRNLLQEGSFFSKRGKSLKAYLDKKADSNLAYEIAIMNFQAMEKEGSYTNEQVIEPLTSYVAKFQDEKKLWQIHRLLSHEYHKLKQDELALTHAKKAENLAPDECKESLACLIKEFSILETSTDSE